MSRANELGEEVGSTIRVHESDNAESNAEQFLVLGLHGLGEWEGWMCRVHDLGLRVGSMSQVHKWDQWKALNWFCDLRAHVSRKK